MFALFDLSQKDRICLTLFDLNSVVKKNIDCINRDLLKEFDLFVKENKLTKNDIQGLAVVTGEGSFTSTRIGTTVANSFAFVNRVPVLAVDLASSLDTVTLVSKLKAETIGKYILPTYSGEPNLGGSK